MELYDKGSLTKLFLLIVTMVIIIIIIIKIYIGATFPERHCLHYAKQKDNLETLS